MTSALVVPTGTANIASVLAGLRRQGAEARLSSDPEEIASATAVVLPGVGTFGAASGRLAEAGVVEVLASRIEEGRPTLAVCVGMQLLFSASEESPGSAGLNVVPDTVTRFPDSVRVPQLGWNLVTPGPGSRLVTEGWAYFANSFRVATAPDGWKVSTSDNGGEFVAAMERGDVLACQFHPELSGDWGAGLLGRWLETSKVGV